MKQTVGVALAVLALAGPPAMAQTTSKSGKAKAAPTMAPETAKKTVAVGDVAFAKEAAIGGMAEVELGNLAKQNAASADVKQFGERMVTDHGKGNDELKQWASQKSVTLPTELDAKHKALRDRLSKLNGAAFDKAYMHEMLVDHREDIAAFKKEAASGKDADLKAWAGKTLPTLEDHLKMAQDTASKAGAAGGATKGKGKSQ